MLFELLKSQNFSGRDYDDFEVEIMDYGFATIRKWIREGDLITECSKASSWPVPNHSQTRLDLLTQEEISELAADIVVDATMKFKQKALIDGGWDPNKRASLRTYFVGRCKLSAINELKRLAKRRQDEEIFDHRGYEQLLEIPSRDMTPEQLLESDEELRAIAGVLNEQEEATLAMHLRGLSHKEIAQTLGITPGAARKIVHRARQKIKTDQEKRGFA